MTDFISDDDMAKLETLGGPDIAKPTVQTASSPQPEGFVSDDDMAKLEAGGKPADDSHDLVPYLGRQAKGLWHLATAGAGGALDAVAHPVDTAKGIANYAGDVLSDPAGDVQGAYRALRNTPIVGDAVNDSVKDVLGLKSLLTGQDDQKATQDYQQGLDANDAVHAKEHPLTDFVQKSVGLAALPQAKVAQVAALSLDSFQKSLREGNDALTAMKDARNTAALTGMMLGAAHAVPRTIGRIAQKEAGITVEAVARYRENPEAVNAAQQHVENPEGLKDLVDEKVAPVLDDVETAKGDLENHRDLATNAQAMARDARFQANQQASNAYLEAKEGLSTTRPPQDLATDIVGDLDGRGEELSRLSGQAFDTLEQEGHAFSAADLAQSIEMEKSRLRINGIRPTIGPDAAAYGALEQFQGLVGQLGEKASREGATAATTDWQGFPVETPGPDTIPAGVVKELIQTADAVSKGAYSGAAGELSPQAARSIANVRRSFDQVLKGASPAYQAQMAELAPKVSILSDMSKVFGDEQGARAALQAAGDPASPRGYVVRKMLGQYDAENGTAYLPQLDRYTQAQATLRSPTGLRDFKSQIPEVQTAAGELPEEASAQAAQQSLEAARATLGQKKTAAQAVSKIGPNSTENVIKSVQGGRNIMARRQLETLDPDLAQTVKDAGVAKQFSKKTTNGSRKAVIGRGVGTAAGAWLGHTLGDAGTAVVGGALGGAVGGAVGGLADVYGGQAVKLALDAGIKLDRLHGTQYVGPLLEAAQRSPQALAVTHYVLTQTDPQYQKLQQGMPGE